MELDHIREADVSHPLNLLRTSIYEDPHGLDPRVQATSDLLCHFRLDVSPPTWDKDKPGHIWEDLVQDLYIAGGLDATNLYFRMQLTHLVIVPILLPGSSPASAAPPPGLHSHHAALVPAHPGDF